MIKRMLIPVGAALALALAMLIGEGCSKSSSTGPGGGGGAGGVVTVTGKVVGQNGQPVAGVPVVVTGKASTNSDAGGNFSIANVTTPYDISVVDAVNKAAILYKGLTRTDPTLLALGSTGGTSHTGSISGKISGGTFTPNQGANDVTNVVFASPEVTHEVSTAVSGTFGPFTLNWFGPTATTGTLYALQFTADAGGLPVASGFKGYGARAGIAVNDGATLTNQFDTLQSVATNQFTGTVTSPSGYTLGGKVVYARVSPVALIPFVSDNTANASVSYYTPGITGASLVLGAQVSKTAGGTAILWKNGLATAATGVSIAVPAPPELSLPVDAATGIDTSVTFSWTQMTGAVHLIIFTASGTGPAYYVLTSGTSATIPNLKPFGLGLPTAAAYKWQVYGFGPFASVDAAAGSTSFLSALLGPPASSAGDAIVGVSTQRTITTAP